MADDIDEKARALASACECTTDFDAIVARIAAALRAERAAGKANARGMADVPYEPPPLGPALPPGVCRVCRKPAERVGSGWRCCGQRWWRDDEDAMAVLGRLVAALPRCIGPWLKGSGGHRLFGKCDAPGMWDCGDSTWFCDEHHHDHENNADDIEEGWAPALREALALMGGAAPERLAVTQLPALTPDERRDRRIACDSCCGTGFTTGAYANGAWGGPVLPADAFQCKACGGSGRAGKGGGG